jgi:hypothetical protein
MMNPQCITRTVQDGKEVRGKAMRTAKGICAAWAHHHLRFSARVEIEVRSAVPLHLRRGQKFWKSGNQFQLNIVFSIFSA